MTVKTAFQKRKRCFSFYNSFDLKLILIGSDTLHVIITNTIDIAFDIPY